MQLPPALIPIATEPFSLHDGRVIAVPKAKPAFPLWRGDKLSFDFGGKPVLDHCGEPCFAELFILKQFLAAGWSGRWVSTYAAAALKPRFLLSWVSESLKTQTHHPIDNPFITGLLDRIVKANRNTYSGCWDVVAWQGAHIVFAESKLSHHDRIRETQRRWFAAGMEAGLRPESFLIVEWSFA